MAKTVDEDDILDNEPERAMNELLGYLERECNEPKKIDDVPINGFLFAELAKHFLECLKEDKICMTMTCSVIVKDRLLGSAIEELEAKLEEVKKKMPMTEKMLENFVRNAREEAEKRIREGSGSDRQQKSILDSFITQADRVQDSINIENTEKSVEKCEQKFDKFRELEDKAHKGLYENGQELRDEAKPMFKNYEKDYDENLGPCRDSVLEKYLGKVRKIISR